MASHTGWSISQRIPCHGVRSNEMVSFLNRNCCLTVSTKPNFSRRFYSCSFKPRPSVKNKTNQLAAVSDGSGITQVSQDNDTSLAAAKVFDLDGKAVQLTDLWKDRKVVIGFARHFGCVLCRKRAAMLASQKSQMDLAGVSLILIGPGSVDQAKAFVDQTKFPGEVYADPNHSAYDAFKFVSGVSTTFTPSAALRIIESYSQGYRQDWGLSFQKDTVNRGGWQQGGIVVAGPGKTNISYIHKDKEAGDDPNIADVMNACCGSYS